MRYCCRHGHQYRPPTMLRLWCRSKSWMWWTHWSCPHRRKLLLLPPQRQRGSRMKASASMLAPSWK